MELPQTLSDALIPTPRFAFVSAIFHIKRPSDNVQTSTQHKADQHLKPTLFETLKRTVVTKCRRWHKTATTIELQLIERDALGNCRVLAGCRVGLR